MITSYGQYSEHGVATGTIKFATRAGKIAWTADKCYMQQKCIVSSQRSLSCELQYNYLCSKWTFPALVATSIVIVSSYSGLKGWHNAKPYLATQMTKGMVKITNIFYCSACTSIGATEKPWSGRRFSIWLAPFGLSRVLVSCPDPPLCSLASQTFHSAKGEEKSGNLPIPF